MFIYNKWLTYYLGSGSGVAEELMTELQGSIQKSLPAKEGTVDGKYLSVYNLLISMLFLEPFPQLL